MARRRVIRFHTLAEAMRRLFSDPELGLILAGLDELHEIYSTSAARSAQPAAWVMGNRAREARELADRISGENTRPKLT